jgi:large subunit ribosomal protein L25
MAEITVVAEEGRTTGSGAARRLRAGGRVPAVVYGHGMNPLSVSVNARELRAVLSVHGINQALTLDVGGKKHLVLARELQRHPVRHTLAHVDFQVVRRDEVVHADVAVVLAGDAANVSRERGILEHTLNSLTVRAPLAQIPPEITVDVSNLSIGDVVRVKDLRLPKGVTTDVDPDETVVIAAASPVSAATAAGEAEAAAAGVQAVEDEGGAPTAGGGEA